MNYVGKYIYINNNELKEKANKLNILFQNIEKNYPNLYKSFSERFPYIEDIKKYRISKTEYDDIEEKGSSVLGKMLDGRPLEEFIFNYYLRSCC